MFRIPRRASLAVALPMFVLLAAMPAARPALAQGTVIASDDFDRADETPFAVGGNWGRVIAGNYDGYAELVGSQVRSASNEGIYYWQGAGTFSATRQFARERVVQKDGEVGLVLLGGPDQAIMVGWGPPGVGSTVYIYWYAGGLDQGQLATGPSSLANGDIVEAVLDGGMIHAKVNGVTVLSVANTTTLTSGVPGFITYLNPGLPGEVSILDDWEAGTPPSYSISGTITESAAGLPGVLVTASGGFSGSAVTDGNGDWTIAGVPPGATSIVLTPTLSGHTMSPPSRTVAGPIAADVTAQDFTSTLNTGKVLTILASNGSVTRDPDEAMYTTGTVVTLTPVPNPGATFTGWSGDVPVGHEADDPLLVTMDQDRTITASFTSPNLIAADDFNRADETPLAVGGNWTQPFGGGSVNLAGNQCVSAAGEALYAWSGAGTFDNARQFARIRVTQAGGQVGLVLLGGPGQALVVSWNAGTLYIYWYSGSSYHGNLTTTSSTLANGDVIEAELDGGIIRAKRNGVVVASVANTTTLTAGNPGFETYQTGASFDDWEAGTPGSWSISGTITENASGLPGVLVTASGGFSGSATTDGNGDYAITGVPDGATSIVLTPALAGHTMSPPSRTVTGAVTADVSGEDFTSTSSTDATLTIVASHGSVTKDPDQTVFTLGTDVTLTPAPDPGFVFAGWSGDVPAGHEADDPLVVTMDQDRTITAHFLPPGLLAFDDFDRPDETPLAVGGNWTQPFGGGSVNLSGNRIVSGTSEALYRWTGSGTFDDARQFARAHVVQAGGQVGLVLLGGPNRALVVSWGGGRLYVYWYLNGSHQGELVNTAMTLQDGDDIEAVVDNGIIYAKINGVVVRSVANTTSLTTGTPGFETYLGGAVFDDWGAGTPTTHAISGTITENAAGLGGVLVTASGGYDGSTTTDGSGGYTLGGVPAGATGILLTPTLAGHTMAPPTRTVAGPVTADVTGQDFTGTAIVVPPGLVAADDFNRADETPLAVGGNWMQPAGGGSANLSGNHVVGVSGDALYAWQGPGTFDNARQFARLRVDQAGGQVGLVLLGGPGHALVVSWNLGTLYFYWYNNGSIQSPLTTVPSTLANGDVIEAVLDGGIITARINGAVVASVANTTPLVTGNPGFETYQGGAALDDWEAGTPPVPDQVAAVPGPGVAISTVTPCLGVPVEFTRVDTTPLFGYSVTFELSPNLALCGAEVVSAGYPLAPRQMLVQPLGGNRWRVDEVTLGLPCGATGSGTLFTIQVASADLNGTGTITVTAVQARDCLNNAIPGAPGAVATIPIDQEGPAQTVDLVATQVKTGNYVAPPDPAHGTTPIQLQFSLPPDAASVEVYRRPFGGYPQYDENGGAPPAPPAALPDAGWTLTGVAAPGGADEPAGRDFWSYVLVTRDAYGNPSPVSNLTPGTLNYHLGDVSTGFATCAGDDHVDAADLSFLGAHYGVALPVNDPLECLDVGPTATTSPDGRPLTDNQVDFEDLVMFALNYEGVSAPSPGPGTREPAGPSGESERVTLESPARVEAGATFEARVDLRAGGRLHGLSVALDWNGAVAEPLAIRSGGLFEGAGGVTFAPGPAALDGVVLGADQPGLVGEGAFAVATFRARAAGDPVVRLVRALGRDARNQPVELDRAVPGPVSDVPAVTRLLPAAPTPFTSGTTIRYALAADADVELAVYRIDGRRVRALERGSRAAGLHRVAWDGRDDAGRAAAPGVYFVRLGAGTSSLTQVIVRLAR